MVTLRFVSALTRARGNPPPPPAHHLKAMVQQGPGAILPFAPLGTHGYCTSELCLRTQCAGGVHQQWGAAPEQVLGFGLLGSVAGGRGCRCSIALR